MKNVPSLPSWSSFVHEANPDSNPPFSIAGTACAEGAAARQSIAAATVETVKLVDVGIENSSLGMALARRLSGASQSKRMFDRVPNMSWQSNLLARAREERDCARCERSPRLFYSVYPTIL